MIGHSRTSRSCPLRQQDILLEFSVSHLAEPFTTPMHVLAGWSQAAEDASARRIRAQPSSSSHFDDVQSQGQEQELDQGQDTIVVRGTTPQLLQTTEESHLPTRSHPAPSSSS
ncbi:uncharacterized protein B0J16DRAFT_200784 [Fusarium flagelliforme]|uniref:uncharacterized protein n=1 Tax=Fusarium flagelliforme TaxID=2675880 RepID=UPI001E8D0321|nr:uncharacterized protein B0J16DRAFT_200784 [Fusarium flagelliforme]KAH7169780.1 hypothetical protein B0J16DRAFT_200784 [Fusarium flagelliforme]